MGTKKAQSWVSQKSLSLHLLYMAYQGIILSGHPLTTFSGKHSHKEHKSIQEIAKCMPQRSKIVVQIAVLLQRTIGSSI